MKHWLSSIQLVITLFRNGDSWISMFLAEPKFDYEALWLQYVIFCIMSFLLIFKIFIWNQNRETHQQGKKKWNPKGSDSRWGGQEKRMEEGKCIPHILWRVQFYSLHLKWQKLFLLLHLCFASYILHTRLPSEERCGISQLVLEQEKRKRIQLCSATCPPTVNTMP